jgi:hypothetical protein
MPRILLGLLLWSSVARAEPGSRGSARTLRDVGLGLTVAGAVLATVGALWLVNPPVEDSLPGRKDRFAGILMAGAGGALLGVGIPYAVIGQQGMRIYAAPLPRGVVAGVTVARF